MRSASRGSSMNSDQRPSGRSVMASRPSSSACHVSSGVFMSPGNRVDRPTIAMSTRSAGPLRDQSVISPSADVSISGSPSMIRVASDSMVGCWKATATESVTPVMSSMSAAIATASRDDKPSSTIGPDSSISSAGLPTALPTQLRSHCRISGTVMSVCWAGVSPPAGEVDVSEFSGRSDSVSAIVPDSVVRAGEGGRGTDTAAQTAVEVGSAAGAVPDLSAGGTGNRSGLHQQQVADRHAVPHGDGRPNVVGDGLVIQLVRTGGALGDDHQLFGGVLGVELEAGVRVVEHLLRQLVRRDREGRHVTGAQCPAGFLRRVLQVLRVVVTTVDNDQVLDAARYIEVAVEVGAVVTGPHPQAVVSGALGVRLADPRLEDVPEGVLGLFFLAPVAHAHVVAVQPDLTDLAVGQLAGRVRVDDYGPLVDTDDARGNLRHRARRIRGYLDETVIVQLTTIDVNDPGRLVHRCSGDEQRRLGQAVGRLDRGLAQTVRRKRIEELAHRRRRHWLAAVEDPFDVAQVQRRLTVFGYTAHRGMLEGEVRRDREDLAIRSVLGLARHLPDPPAGPAHERGRGHEGEVVTE